MKRYLFAVLLPALAFSIDAADPESIPIGRFIGDLARENEIAVVGLSLVGNDTFAPFKKSVSVDKALARALGRYNYIVNYEDQRIVRITILGRKGSSVGELPDDTPPLVPSRPPETGEEEEED